MASITRLLLQHSLFACLLLVLCVSASSCASVRKTATEEYYKSRPFVERIYAAPEQYIRLKCGNVCYVEKGTGPTLLILPGLSLGAHNWRFNLARYWEKFHVVLLDLPGYGKSDAPDAEYSINFFKEAVLEFMEKKGIRRAAILGHSLGGQVGIVLAAEHPEKVDTLILETATGVRPRYGFVEDFLIETFITAKRFAFLPEDKLREYTELNFFAPCPAQEELIAYQLSFRAHFRGQPIFDARNESFVRGARHIIMTDVRNDVPKIHVPTLIMWGRNDRLDGVKNAYWLYLTIPQAQLYILEQCGHQPHLEKPLLYDYAILKYLEQFYAGRSSAVEPAGKEAAGKIGEAASQAGEAAGTGGARP